jgi:uncharacterized membrane protein YGL010W
MRKFDEWMNEYSVSHQHPINQKIHKICVPLIMLSVIGLLWKLPVPNSFHQLPYLNWASIFVVLCNLFYLSLSFKMLIGMMIQSFVMLIVSYQLEKDGVLLTFSIVVFVLSWIGQFWGHHIEGRKPSFFQDIFFLLIGPLWVTRFLYQKMGIKI